MGNKRAKQKKPKQNKTKMTGSKGGQMSTDTLGSPAPVRKGKK
jgi:hypothetical protein